MLYCLWETIFYFSIEAITIQFVYRYLILCRQIVISDVLYTSMLFIPLLSSIIMAILLAYAGYPDRYNDHFPSNSSLLDRLREYPTDEIPIALKASPLSFEFQLALGIVFVADTVCYGIIIWCSYRIVSSVNKAFTGMTEKSRLRDINKQLTYTLIAQASIPALMLGGVSFAVILSLFFMKDLSSIYNFVYLTVPFTWLPVLSPLITILIVRNYRNFILCHKGMTQTPVMTIHKSPITSANAK
ncbi:serpentine type 7TM GPCR chemoreceptor str domain-containing protein [Ditylenchus destructor]|uniref:Serpentine type 7TM GPCR chemoreceptor str domain-containing protein n=1 Tax=Ditylenchus destructor TaxID=166010 RepID=A0AAD4N5P2_9BILA|nr:serpentine type 7TM GPCR chemoreceptor str domain-containing protein [Ditylenchus destructor]